MAQHKVTSEIVAESEDSSEQVEAGKKLSHFHFKCPSHCRANGEPSETSETSETSELTYDDDGDLDLRRSEEGVVSIEHSTSTELRLVGLQIWRGAFLLADYVLSNPQVFGGRTILELGSGVGFTSIVAGFLARRVVCTDVNVGGILQLIERNFQRNRARLKARYVVKELNFLDENWRRHLRHDLRDVNFILAADVIYDDEITEGFVGTLARLLDEDSSRTAYVALEKRYVFTTSDLDSVAPMYEEFLRCVARRHLRWSIEHLPTDFPRYFKYDRVKQMVLMRIRNGQTPNGQFEST